MSDTEELVAVVCGRCDQEARATQVPDFCPACGARDADRPVLLIYLGIGLRFDGGGIRAETTFRREYRGTWDPDARAAMERREFTLIEGGADDE